MDESPVIAKRVAGLDRRSVFTDEFRTIVGDARAMPTASTTGSKNYVVFAMGVCFVNTNTRSDVVRCVLGTLHVSMAPHMRYVTYANANVSTAEQGIRA